MKAVLRSSYSQILMWRRFAYILWGFTVFTIIATVGICFGFGFLLVAMTVRETTCILKDFLRKR